MTMFSRSTPLFRMFYGSPWELIDRLLADSHAAVALTCKSPEGARHPARNAVLHLRR